ncbi:MAG: helix-turn-helix transcriptional regulator [Mycobacterium sp.]|nr:helix-turn-helix transcriptional regulator [Mycobacterium sp.]
MQDFGDPDTGQPLTPDALYKIIENEPDLAMSRSSVYRLVEGSAIPRLDLIEALARFFAVPASYFVDDQTYADETLTQVGHTLTQLDALKVRLSELRVTLARDRDSEPRQRKADKPTPGDTAP